MPQGGEALGKEERAAEVFSGEEESAAQHNSYVGETYPHPHIDRLSTRRPS